MSATIYQELTDEFNPQELELAYRALMNSDLQADLYEKESPLLTFFFDTHKQDLLYEWVEDQDYFKTDDDYNDEIIDVDGC